VFAFDDMVRGHVEFQASGIGDFIIVKSDGIPVYNFAVVIDDAKMGITHVIRAEEHLSNTPRQLAIYEALGYEVPKFGHISLILGADHKKMSKRHGATSVTEYRNMGYLPQAMFNYLALLGWAPQGEQEIFSVDELVKQFSMNRVSSNDAVFDIEKLNWINFQYMKQLTPDQLLELTLPFIEKAGYVQEPIDADKKEWLKAVVWYVRDHLYYGAQAPENVKVFFEDLPALQDPELLAVMKAETSALIIKSFAEELKKLESFDADSIKSCFTRLMKETKVKGKAAFEPVRIALTGVTHGPGLYDMIALFGKEKAVKLLEDALAYCSDN
jgi:glutamate--tRNA ligase